jgi:hypothetical protein
MKTGPEKYSLRFFNNPEASAEAQALSECGKCHQ